MGINVKQGEIKRAALPTSWVVNRVVIDVDTKLADVSLSGVDADGKFTEDNKVVKVVLSDSDKSTIVEIIEGLIK